jgi:phosphocarrier protein
MTVRIRSLVEVKAPEGLHLREAHRFVLLAQGFLSDVRVSRGATIANGKSVLDLLCLGAPGGSWLEIEVEGPDAPGALLALTELIHGKFVEQGRTVSTADR